MSAILHLMIKLCWNNIEVTFAWSIMLIVLVMNVSTPLAHSPFVRDVWNYRHQALHMCLFGKTKWYCHLSAICHCE